MHIYFSGIGGVAIGPLAMISKELGYTVSGSDLAPSLTTQQLEVTGITVQIGQTGQEIAKINAHHPIDWLVHSSAIKDDNPELAFAKSHGIKTSKRHEFINQILKDKNLRMIAVSGTHGKTTTTGMLIWLFQKMGIPASYSIGTNISFGPAGHYEPGSEFFIYEADEFDKNFLNFNPELSLIPNLDYDHPETFPTVQDYQDSFKLFLEQSDDSIIWQETAYTLNLTQNEHLTILQPNSAEQHLIKLAGEHTRLNARLAIESVAKLFPQKNFNELVEFVNTFPGTERRFEKLAPGLFSDYAHHPTEIKATLEMARELSQKVVVVYQPHQNIRQHNIKEQYKDCFKDASKIYWLPTYLSREDKNLPTLAPTDLIAHLSNAEIAKPVEMNDELIESIKKEREDGALVLLMSAGSLDQWARNHLAAF